MSDLQELFVSENQTIRDVMALIDRGARGLALVVDEGGRFVATITDGDVRRAILAGALLDSHAAQAMTTPDGQKRRSITASCEAPCEEQLRLMQKYGIRHLPLLDNSGRVVDLATFLPEDDLEDLSVQAVIMAGGFGKRLRPLTDDMPKPMLSIGGQPLMERTIRNLERAGIHRINITTHYLPEKITSYFGSGQQLGVELTYVSEDEPLGTAGAIAMVENSDDPLLVLNGDILTRIDYRALVEFHQDRRADLTIGVRQYEIEVPYGVIEATDGIVQSLREKPKYSFLVNAGVYILEPAARRRIPPGRKYNMTDLIDELLASGRTVACFPIIEYWLDIGKHDDFQRAQHDVREQRWAA